MAYPSPGYLDPAPGYLDPAPFPGFFTHIFAVYLSPATPDLRSCHSSVSCLENEYYSMAE